MVSGAIFAGNYFGGEIKTLADSIRATPQFNTAICSGCTGWSHSSIYMISGDGGMGAETKPFNEYMMVAYLAMLEETSGTNALDYYTDCFGLSGKPVGRGGFPGASST